MNYYSLYHRAIGGGYTDGDVEFSPVLDDYYHVGQNICLDELSVRLVLDKRVRKLKSDFFSTTCGAFFVSERMKSVLEECRTELGFALVDVKYYDGKAVEGEYYFIHSCKETDCFDYENSVYSGKLMVLSRYRSNELANDYKVRGIKVFYIDEPKTGSLDFIFVSGVIWLAPIVSEVFADKARKQKLLVRLDEIGSGNKIGD